jgi:ribosomal protein L5
MALPNFYKKKLLLRNLPKNNVNSLNFLESGVIYYPLKKEYTLGSVVTCCALLKLITMKSASILRARKSSAVLKIRKGAPVGAKLTLRKKDLQLFYYRLLYQVLPQLNNKQHHLS